jgi:hypothetical protein
MLRHLLAAALVLLLSSAPLSARPNDFDLAADCTVGRAGGEWDLPVGDQPGYVRGILVDATGRRVGLEGWLTPVRTRDGIVRGRLDGALYPLKKDDRFHPRAIAGVSGTWVAGPEGRGRFRASIVELAPGNSNHAVTAAGRVAGVFSDRPGEGLADPVGAFACRWKICR